MAQDTTLPQGSPGIASFATQSYGGPAEPRYGEGVPTTTDQVVAANADLNLPIYSVVSVIGGVLSLAVLGASTGFATGTITLSVAVPTAGETVVVGGQTYTFRAAPTPPAVLLANEVLIGANINASAANLAAAINAGAGAGTVYGAGTVANASVQASVAAAVVTVTALVAGSEGNAITLTETGANIAVSGATLSGGSDDRDLKPFGILSHPVILGNGQSMSVSLYRQGHWDMDVLNWHSSFATETARKRAFEGSHSPTIFISKKKFNNDQIAV